MTKVDACKILGISPSASLKSAEQAYRQKCRNLQFRMAPGNIRSEREQAQSDLVKLVEAWKIMQTKQTTSRRTVNQPKPRPAVNQPKPINRQTTFWDVIHDLAQNWNIVIGMSPFPKPATIAILAVYFLLVVITLFFHLAKGA
jgi:hypothetical protein